MTVAMGELQHAKKRHFFPTKVSEVNPMMGFFGNAFTQGLDRKGMRKQKELAAVVSCATYYWTVLY